MLTDCRNRKAWLKTPKGLCCFVLQRMWLCWSNELIEYVGRVWVRKEEKKSSFCDAITILIAFPFCRRMWRTISWCCVNLFTAKMIHLCWANFMSPTIAKSSSGTTKDAGSHTKLCVFILAEQDYLIRHQEITCKSRVAIACGVDWS